MHGAGGGVILVTVVAFEVFTEAEFVIIMTGGRKTMTLREWV